MKFFHAAAGGLLLAIVPLAASADDMSYTYANLEWTEVDPDMSPNGDGPSVRGSVGFAKHYFAFAEYGSFDIDMVDIELISVGLGGHLALSDQLDFVGRAGYVEVDISAPGFSDSQDGWLVSAGLRGRVAERIELEGSLMQRDLGAGGDDTVYTFGGRYHFNPLFAIGAEYQMSDEVSIAYAGVRFSF